MDRLWALKNDYGLPAGRIFSLLRCTAYRCPYCNYAFKVTWGPSNSLLGSGGRACWHCKQVFWDGSNEWPEMSSEDRHLFLVPITIAGIIAGFILILALVMWTKFFLMTPVHFRYRLFFLALGLPIGLWFGFRALQVNRSIRRYNERGGKRVP